MNLRSGALIIAILVQSVSPQRNAESGTKKVDPTDATDRPALLGQLAEQYQSDPKAFDGNDTGYRVAHIAEAEGRKGLAVAWFLRETQRGTMVSDRALVRISRLARSSGNLLLESILLRTHQRNVVPNSRLAPAVVDRLAANSLESGDAIGAIQFLTSTDVPIERTVPGLDFTHRRRKVLIAQAFAATRRNDEAQRVFTELLDGGDAAHPDEHSYSAVKGLDTLDDIDSRSADVGEAEHKRRATIYQYYRDFERARIHWNALIDRYPSSAADALLKIGRSFAQADEYGEAVKSYERLLERHPDSPMAKDGLLQLAGAYARVGKPKEALARYQAFIERYPADERLDRAYLNQVDILRDSSDLTEALRACERAEAGFPGMPAETAAVFVRGRIYLARQEWQEALTTFDKLAALPNLGSDSIPGGTNTAEVAFLRGVALEKLGRYSDAIEAYLAIPDGRAEYYGWQATKRLQGLMAIDATASIISARVGALTVGLKAKDPETRRWNALGLLRLTDAAEAHENALAALKIAYKELPKYASPPTIKPRTATADNVFARIGAYDDAVIEFESKETGNTELWIKANRGDKAILVIEPLWKRLSADYPIDLMPRDQLRLMYPLVYRNLLLAAADRDDVDPRLLLAIMRQESRFQPAARSAAGARGLMQFISTTSTEVARNLNMTAFDQTELYDPETAILFGSRHTADLFKIFPGQTEAVVAAYNAGDDNVKRWLTRAHSDQPERYVPEIMFTQTKDYVYRVMTNLRMYQFLYDENLHPTN